MNTDGCVISNTGICMCVVPPFLSLHSFHSFKYSFCVFFIWFNDVDLLRFVVCSIYLLYLLSLGLTLALIVYFRWSCRCWYPSSWSDPPWFLSCNQPLWSPTFGASSCHHTGDPGKQACHSDGRGRKTYQRESAIGIKPCGLEVGYCWYWGRDLLLKGNLPSFKVFDYCSMSLIVLPPSIVIATNQVVTLL